MMDPVQRQIEQKEALGHLLGVIQGLTSGLAHDERSLRRAVKVNIHELSEEVRPRIESVLDSLIMDGALDEETKDIPVFDPDADLDSETKGE
jgi:hypothetical protein